MYSKRVCFFNKFLVEVQYDNAGWWVTAANGRRFNGIFCVQTVTNQYNDTKILNIIAGPVLIFGGVKE